MPRVVPKALIWLLTIALVAGTRAGQRPGSRPVAVEKAATQIPTTQKQTTQNPTIQDRGEGRLREFIAQVQSLKAEFRQELRSGDGKLIEESRGHLSLSRPGRFRWDYVSPHERVVAADGVHVWLYEADLQQVTERSFERTIGNTPAALLTGGSDIYEQFDFVGSTKRGGLQWVQLRPRSADADFSAISVGFAGNRLSGLELDDRLGQHTRITLTGVELNPHIDEQMFHFKTPAGVDVIREDEL
jgi:outer membrane lipoprotein carrier protein